MDSIVVNVSELLSRLQEIQRDGMDYVELFLIEAGDELPACINLSACEASDTGAWTDYEEIDALEIESP